MKVQEFAKYVDHTLLKPEAPQSDYVACFEFAKQHDTATVCVFPMYIELAKEYLKDTDVKVCTVIGFPHGTNTTASKVFEAQDAVKRGADEVDMVMSISAFLSGRFDYVLEDMKAVVQAVDVPVKVIIETAYLSKEQIAHASKLVEESGAAFVKTSTGFAGKGATVEDVKIMRASVSDKVQIKAAGGISNMADADAMVEAGATRLGISRTASIISGIGDKSDDRY